MPIYEYACPDCGSQFDALQRFSDDPITECPSCKAGNVKKKVSATSFILKGSGWYKDHYGLKAPAADSGGSSEGKSSDAPAAPAASGAAASGAAASGAAGSGSSGAAPAASAPAAAPAAPSSAATK